MSTVEFKVDGFKELYKAMDDIAEEIGKGKTDKIWRESLKSAMEIVLTEAKANAPKRSGQLADHIYMKVHRPMRRDKAGKYYDGEMYMARVTVSPLRDDTVADVVLNKRGKFQTVYRNKRPVAISQEFGNARTPAHPFLRTALEKSAQSVANALEFILRTKIQEIARAKARGGSN